MAVKVGLGLNIHHAQDGMVSQCDSHVRAQITGRQLANTSDTMEKPAGDPYDLVVRRNVHCNLLGNQTRTIAAKTLNKDFQIDVWRGQDELAQFECRAHVITGCPTFNMQFAQRGCEHVGPTTVRDQMNLLHVGAGSQCSKKGFEVRICKLTGFAIVRVTAQQPTAAGRP